MRAFGQGSLSSILRSLLGVVVWGLWLLLGVSVLALAFALLVQPFLGAAGPGRSGELVRLLRRGPPLFGLLAAACVYWGALLLTAIRLRQLFATLIVGRPFSPENVGRLRVIGLSLIVLELAGGFASVLGGPALSGAPVEVRVSSGNLSAWFSIVVVFVLAEVFREGSRLQAEQELTV